MFHHILIVGICLSCCSCKAGCVRIPARDILYKLNIFLWRCLGDKRRTWVDTEVTQCLLPDVAYRIAGNLRLRVKEVGSRKHVIVVGRQGHIVVTIIRRKRGYGVVCHHHVTRRIGKSGPFRSCLISIVAPKHRIVHFGLTLTVFQLQSAAIKSKGAIHHLRICSYEGASKVAMEDRVADKSLSSSLTYRYGRHFICRAINAEVATVHGQFI